MGDEVSELKSHIKRQLSKGYTREDIKKALIESGFPSSEVNAAFRPFEPKKASLLHRIFKPKKAEKKPAAEKKAKQEKKPALAKKEKPSKTGQLTGRKPSEEKRPLLHRIFKPVPAPKFPKKEEKPMPEPEEQALPETEELALPEPEKRLALPPPPAPRVIEHRKMSAYLIMILAVIVFTAAVLFLFSPAGCITEECFIEKANQCEPAQFKNSIKETGVRYEANNCILTKTITSLGPEEPAEIVSAFLGKNMTCRYQMHNFNPLYLTTVTGLINTCEGELKTAILEHAV